MPVSRIQNINTSISWNRAKKSEPKRFSSNISHYSHSLHLLLRLRIGVIGVYIFRLLHDDHHDGLQHLQIKKCQLACKQNGPKMAVSPITMATARLRR